MFRLFAFANRASAAFRSRSTAWNENNLRSAAGACFEASGLAVAAVTTVAFAPVSRRSAGKTGSAALSAIASATDDFAVFSLASASPTTRGGCADRLIGAGSGRPASAWSEAAKARPTHNGRKNDRMSGRRGGTAFAEVVSPERAFMRGGMEC